MQEKAVKSQITHHSAILYSSNALYSGLFIEQKECIDEISPEFAFCLVVVEKMEIRIQ